LRGGIDVLEEIAAPDVGLPKAVAEMPAGAQETSSSRTPTFYTSPTPHRLAGTLTIGVGTFNLRSGSRVRRFYPWTPASPKLFSGISMPKSSTLRSI
jgi:hypothetical protein